MVLIVSTNAHVGAANVMLRLVIASALQAKWVSYVQKVSPDLMRATV